MDPDELTLPPLRLRSRVPQRAALLGAGLLVLGGGLALAVGGVGGASGLLSWMRPGEEDQAARVPLDADTGRSASPEAAHDTGRADAPERAGATGRQPEPQAASATGRDAAPEAAAPTGRADAPDGSTATGRADAPQDAPPTGRHAAPEDAPPTGRHDAPEEAPATGRHDAPEGAPVPERVDEPETPPVTGRDDAPEGPAATGRADAPQDAPPTGRADAPDGSTATGRSDEALPYPTGRREGLPPDQIARVRPDGSEVVLRRIPAGPVRVDGARIHEPAFWIEVAPASLAAYARFLRATQRAGDPLEPLYPAGEAGAFLREHVERDDPLPVGPVTGLSPAAADAFLRWSGLVPLSPRQRLRAEQWGQVPAGDLRGGLSDPREGR